MSSKSSQLHIMFFPFMAYGHMIPITDMAKLFASRGCKTTLVLTPVNASFFAKTIERSRDLGLEIEIVLLRFPTAEVGLPEGCENTRLATTTELQGKFFAAITTLFQQPLEQLVMEYRPDCLIADSLFPCATEVAAKLGIPRIVFQVANFFTLSASTCLMEYEPHKKVSSDSEPFVIPNFPHEIKFTMDQLPVHLREESKWRSFARKMDESALKSFGSVVNSFYEVEPDYADHYRRVLGRKAWHVGPLSLLNKDREDKAQRGHKSSIGENECLNWLNSKEQKSVVYVSFGTEANFTDEQLMEITKGLEASGKQFIWVVKKEKREGVREEWLPEGFEKRVEGKGLIIRGWAPQVLILDHQAIGGFVTHCGWNSVLEGICAGLPMATWPVVADQFYCEKFVTQILGIGVGVGAGKWVGFQGDSVKSEAIAKAVSRIMAGDEAEEMRGKAKALAEMARKAFGEGGSSHSDLDSLIQELKLRKSA